MLLYLNIFEAVAIGTVGKEQFQRFWHERLIVAESIGSQLHHQKK